MTTLTATLTVAAIYLSCPICDAVVADNNGSEMLEEHDYERLPNTIQCGACDHTFRKPAWPKQRVRKVVVQ